LLREKAKAGLSSPIIALIRQNMLATIQNTVIKSAADIPGVEARRAAIVAKSINRVTVK